MAASTTEAPRTGQEGKAPEDAASATPGAAPAAAGGIKAWLPLIIAIVTMPLLAFATTKFVLLPRLEAGMGKKAESESSAPAKSAAEGESSSKEEGKAGSKSSKISVPLTKMLVNVAGTMGTRYLMTSVTLVGTNPDFKTKIEDNKDQLMDLATGTLSSKTIADLEKPGSRNIIRSELMAVFNNALGSPLIQEIYITEMAIQ